MRRTQKQPPTHDPPQLYRASIERMDDAQSLLGLRKYPGAMYMAGLAVETLLQAYALRAGTAHDARHDLSKWLSRCPSKLQQALKAKQSPDDWSVVFAGWQNELRYLSTDGLWTFIRQRRLHVRYKGSKRDRMAQVAKALVHAANAVHRKGIVTWQHCDRR